MKSIEDFLNKYPHIDSEGHDDYLPHETPEWLEFYTNLINEHLKVCDKLTENPNIELTELELKLLRHEYMEVEDYQEPILDDDPIYDDIDNAFYDDVYNNVYEPTEEDLEGEQQLRDDIYYESIIINKLENTTFEFGDKEISLSKYNLLLINLGKQYGYKELSYKSKNLLLKLLRAEYDKLS